jgi:2-hydroxychromene-2-carboxylate isomerase
MSKTVEFYFDVVSPTSYLAFTQLPRIAQETGAEIGWRPVLLGAIFKATGNASPMHVPAKGRYMLQDMPRFAARYGVPMALNPHFPMNSLTVMRGATALQLQHPQKFLPYVTAMFKAMWIDALNLGDAQVLAQAIAAAGLDSDAILALAARQEVKDRLRADTEAAVKRGVFGVPTLFVGEQMFFGQDRLDFVREALTA